MKYKIINLTKDVRKLELQKSGGRIIIEPNSHVITKKKPIKFNKKDIKIEKKTDRVTRRKKRTKRRKIDYGIKQHVERSSPSVSQEA